MIPDKDLLHEYVQNGSEGAFAEIVHRYVALAYSAALRLLSGETALAEDAVQSVFVDLARKAGQLDRHTSLAGWVHTSVRFTALRLRRDEHLRRMREQEAATMQNVTTQAELDWNRMSPELDAAIASLAEPDREAVLLRFFQGWSHRDVSTALNLSEDAARMRIDRALDKLRGYFARHGIHTTGALLATCLGAHAVTPVPPAFARTLPDATLAAAAPAGAQKISYAVVAALVILAAVFLIVFSSARRTSPPTVHASSPSTLTPNNPPMNTSTALARSVLTTALVLSTMPAASAQNTPAMAVNSVPAATASASPVPKFQPGDTLLLRLTAMQTDLQAAEDNLKQAPANIHGGYTEKALANIHQALANVNKAFDYVHAHPEINPVNAWSADDTMGGHTPTPLPTLPRYAGTSYRRGGQMTLVNANQGVDEFMLQAFARVRLAATEFVNVYPEMKPYQVGDIGGYRNLIRNDLNAAATNIIAGMDYAHTPPSPPSATGELVANGSFESPPAPTNRRIAAGNYMVSTSDGNEPPSFGWRVKSGSAYVPAGPVILSVGYASAGEGDTLTFNAPAYDGKQWLVLSGGGSGTNGSSIMQNIATTPGQTYTLTFAYASSPYAPLRGEPHPNSATVSIQDPEGDGELITPVTFTHNSATPEDYHWQRSAPITFTAKSPRTTIQFKANYTSRGVFDGVFLDGISVKPSAPATQP